MPPADFVMASGFWLWVINRLGCDGLTMPWRTIYMRPEYFYEPELRAHELVHIDQINRLGPVTFSIVYLWQMAKYGYWNMPLEIEARALSNMHPGVCSGC
jgi:hypothetical protein